MVHLAIFDGANINTQKRSIQMECFLILNIKMGRLFEYFAEHALYDSFDMGKFLDLQGCLTKYAFVNEFKKLVEVIKSSKSNTKEYKAAKKFADKIANDAYQILEQPSFVNYWARKEEMVTRTRLNAAQRGQALQQVKVYAETLDELGNSSHDDTSDDNYSARESTPSSSSSPSEDEEEGRSNVVLCGILMRGSDCHVYAFDHKYDGLYRAILLKTIYMPASCYDMHRVQSIIPLFQKLALIVESSALILRNPSSSNRIPDAVPSMHTPTIIRTSKRKLDKKSPAVLHARRRLFK